MPGAVWNDDGAGSGRGQRRMMGPSRGAEEGYRDRVISICGRSVGCGRGLPSVNSLEL